MIFEKNWQFFHLFILGKIGKEKVFYDILDKKKPFKTIKISSWKSRTIEIFPKGLVDDFFQQLAIFPSLYFRQNRPGKGVLRYSW